MPAQTVIKVRRDTAANWISADPTLASGEIGFETDTNQLKIGNGSSAWTALDYTSGGASVEISETAPASPDLGNVWFNSTDGRAYIYYDNAWVDLNPGIAGPAGFVPSTTAPTNTSVLWLDTDETPDVPVPPGGTTGQLLAKIDGTDYNTEWVDNESSTFAIQLNEQTISANYAIPAGYNGVSAGPITIASGAVVTIPTGSSWSIV